ncbi:MAG: Response regulator [Myxococcaceae bacterium]|nr:Response regulator [Myxococcaceae bacterium]
MQRSGSISRGALMDDVRNRKYRILVVDDDASQVELSKRMLEREGFVVESALSAIGVTNIVRSFAPHVVLLDVQIPALSGDRLLLLVRKNAPAATKLVLFSACDEEHLRSLAREVQADDWISKSWDLDRVARRLFQLCAADARS